MTYRDLGFRSLYHSFVAIERTDDLKPAVEGYVGAEDADAAILYGYIDHEAGFSFAIIAVGRNTDISVISSPEPNNGLHSLIRAEKIADYELRSLDECEEMLSTLHAEKLEMMKVYDVSDEIQETRTFGFLDNCRDEFFVDDIKVMLIKGDLQPEVCWARIEGTTENSLKAVLLNEPFKDFGCQIGDKLWVNTYKTDDDEIICYCKLD